MLESALLCSLVYFLLNSISWLTDLEALKRPLIAGPVIGLFLGDVQTGIVMGAALEGIFMGVSAIGGSIPSDSLLGTIIAVSYTILSGADAAVGLAIAMPIGTMVNSIGSFFIPLFAATSPYWEELAASGKTKKFIVLNVLFTVICYNLIACTVIFAGVAFGTDALQQFLNSVPPFVTSGLAAASGIMMGVGFAILLSMLWRKDIAFYLIVGYVLTVYGGVPTVGVALVGTVIAIFVFMMEKRFQDQNNLRVSVDGTKEEDFFDE